MHPGEVLGRRFELAQRVGAGGMGEVFRARDRASNEAVAVKVLLARQALDRRRFEREAEVLKTLSHPGIVGYVAHGETPSGELYLAMEWLSGEDLAGRLSRGPLSLEETVAVGLQVAGALTVAHARGVVHRDLKPSNLFLKDGDVRQLRLLDFGIARRLDGTPLTEMGTVLGTPGYMAPEQVLTGEEIDARVDVFALGSVLFECITGAPAFAGAHFMAVLAKILYQPTPRIREHRADVPPGLDALLSWMLAKKPAERPSSMAAVAATLTLLTTGGTPMEEEPAAVSGPPPSLTGEERRVLSLVLVGRAPVPLEDPLRTLARDEGAGDSGVEALREAAAARGGRLELLADGSAIVTLRGPSVVATDQATHVARAALALHPLVGQRPMAMAFGWAEVMGAWKVGEVIDRAAEMLAQLASAPQGAGGARPIAIDEVTAGLLDARFLVTKEATGFALHGEQEIAESQRMLLGKPTTCVGRDRELALLEATLASAVEEQTAQAVLVTGPAGIGKSRVAHELIGWARRRGDGTAIWIGSVDAMGTGSTLGLLGQVLRSALGIQDGEPVEARRDKILARVGEHGSAATQRRVAMFLGEMVGTPFPAEASVELQAARQSAPLMADQMRWAWVDFLRAESAAHPILLVLEDLHWGDASTVRLVGAALREVSDQPWMALALGRPEVHALFPKLWAQHQPQEIRLQELSRKASEQLVRQVLGDDGEPALLESVVTQAGGHPFYLEELTRAAAEGQGAALPRTVLAMVEARLAGLDVEARRLLRAASVFGEAFWRGGLQALLGSEIEPGALEALVKQELLRRRPESRFAGEPEFSFRHALLREGAYAMLTDQDRALGHRLAGAWLESRGETDPLLLAEHFERGGERARAGGFYLQAATQAMRAAETTLALTRAHRGLACDGPEEVRRALLGTICEVQSLSHQTMSATLPFAEELLRLAPQGSLPWVQAAFAKLIGTLIEGRLEEFRATLRVVQQTEPSPEAAGSLALTLAGTAHLLSTMGLVEEGEALVERLTVMAGTIADRHPRVSLLWNSIMSWQQGYVREDPFCGLAHDDAALATAERINDGRMLKGMLAIQGIHLWLLGAFGPALQALEGAQALDGEIALTSSFRRFSLAWLLADRGAFAEARVWATSLIEGVPLPLNQGRGHWALAEVLRRTGELEQADREVSAALAALRAAAPLEYTGALGTLSAIRLAQGRPGEALAAAEEALSRCETMGTCAFMRGSLVRLAHAEALEAAGHPARARAALAVARERLLANAAKIEDPTYRAGFLENVPENARILALAGAWLD